MIFYFTGTGNSLYAAQQLAAEGEQIVSMIDALRAGSFHYTLQAGVSYLWKEIPLLTVGVGYAF